MPSYISLLLNESYPLLGAGQYIADKNDDIYVVLPRTEFAIDDSFSTNYRIMSLETGMEANLDEEREFLRQGWRKVSYPEANRYFKRTRPGEELPKNRFDKWYAENPKPKLKGRVNDWGVTQYTVESKINEEYDPYEVSNKVNDLFNEMNWALADYRKNINSEQRKRYQKLDEFIRTVDNLRSYLLRVAEEGTY